MAKIYLPLITILSLILIVFYVIARKNLRRISRGATIHDYYEAMSNLSNHFPGRVSRNYKFFHSQPSFDGDFSGHKFKITFWRSEVIGVPPSKLLLSCHVESKSKLKIYIYRKNPGTVLFAERINIGDNDLDQFFIYSNRPDEAKRYFFDVSRRTVIKHMVQKGWEPPHIASSKISTEIGITQPELDPEFIKETLKMMIALQV